MSKVADNLPAGTTVAVIGLGNIGSQLLGHVARLRQVRRIICVDPDAYAPANMATQEICIGDVGIAKASAAARRLHGIRKDLEATAIVDRVENVPWGQVRADVICGCVDSKGARAGINLIARRLGMPYVDAGIRADGLMARVDVYGSGPDGPCLECAWGQKDYESLGRAYSCAGEIREAPSTGATSALGGLAAAMQAMECRKILEGVELPSSSARQVVIEAVCHQLMVNALRRNPTCRFDHGERQICGMRGTTLAEVAAEGEKMIGEAPAAIAVESKSWVTRLACRGCSEQVATLRLQGRIGRRLIRCPRCGDQRQAVGFNMLPRLELCSVPRGLMNQPLARLGLRVGDVVQLRGAQREQCIELIG